MRLSPTENKRSKYRRAVSSRFLHDAGRPTVKTRANGFSRNGNIRWFEKKKQTARIAINRSLRVQNEWARKNVIYLQLLTVSLSQQPVSQRILRSRRERGLRRTISSASVQTRRRKTVVPRSRRVRRGVKVSSAEKPKGIRAFARKRLALRIFLTTARSTSEV